MLDIHSHILPGVDDGSEGMEESINMAKMYIENGIDRVIATPHFIEENNSTMACKNRVILESLNKNLQEEEIDLKVYLGNEVYVSPEMFAHLEEGKVATLNGSRYVLMETAMFDLPVYMENIVYELCLKGYIPIIAHPERNAKIQQNPNILYKLIMGGALAQINLPSLEGRYGGKAKETAKILLTHNMVHFVGTDAHSPRTRSPEVKKGLKILKEIVDTDEFEELTILNGEAILEDRDIPVDEPIKYEERKKKSFFSLW